MKKLILLACLSISFLSVNARVYYTRSNGFLRHYDYVQQENFNNGDIIMNCSDPGWSRCKPMPLAIVYHGTETPISDSDYMSIDNHIEEVVTEMNTSGAFVFNNSFYVTYNYDVRSDALTTTLYTLEEAKDLHLLN
jgi:hypothetical protein